MRRTYHPLVCLDCHVGVLWSGNTLPRGWQWIPSQGCAIVSVLCPECALAREEGQRHGYPLLCAGCDSQTTWDGESLPAKWSRELRPSGFSRVLCPSCGQEVIRGTV